MTILALKLSRRANAVSSLHGQVSRAMWTPLYPGASEEQVPIGHITNGIHVRTWLAHQMHQLYDRHLGPDWPERCAEPGTWDADRRHRRRRALGDASNAEDAAHRSGAAARGALRRAARRADRVRRSGAPRAQPRRAHDWIRAPVRHLQAREPRAARYGRTASRWSTTRRCRFSSSSRARRTRATARAKKCCSRVVHVAARPAFRRKAALHRGLRHQRRPVSRAGRRRVAQHAATPPRSVRHERSESRAERRAQPVDPGRMVGRGLRRPQRFRHRARRNAHVDRSA